MTIDRWVIHPSRFMSSEPAVATPFRVIAPVRRRRGEQVFTCVARVPMPVRAGGRRDKKGRLDFDGDSWSEVTGSALMFARRTNPQAPRIGAKYPRRKSYSWWDGSTSADNILAGDDAAEHVRCWLEHVFPTAAGRIEVFAR
jgi:hypothetical protein